MHPGHWRSCAEMGADHLYQLVVWQQRTRRECPMLGYRERLDCYIPSNWEHSNILITQLPSELIYHLSRLRWQKQVQHEYSRLETLSKEWLSTPDPKDFLSLVTTVLSRCIPLSLTVHQINL